MAAVGGGAEGRVRPSDAELQQSLSRILAASGRAEPVKIIRRPSAYRTSFPLEELDLELGDGTHLRLAFKQLGWSTLDKAARLAKPEFLHDARREAAVYASVLAPARLGAPRYYGSVAEPAEDRHWLFVEWIEGRELYQVGELALWGAAARWLAAAHVALAGDLDRHVEAGHLVEYDERYYRRWIERAGEFATGGGGAASGNSLEWLRSRYGAVVESLLELPRTVLHGEFYASNVLIAGEESAPRVAPVDWEVAASGPGLVDLAALVSGDWRDEDRGAIVDAYRSVPGIADFSARQLDLARLHLAVQWLGWAPPSWVPPEGQRHDWLGEALGLAEGLGL
jgi:aminoglycoside phosphotransferase (APT) family kinase protein